MLCTSHEGKEFCISGLDKRQEHVELCFLTDQVKKGCLDCKKILNLIYTVEETNLSLRSIIDPRRRFVYTHSHLMPPRPAKPITILEENMGRAFW